MDSRTAAKQELRRSKRLRQGQRNFSQTPRDAPANPRTPQPPGSRPLTEQNLSEFNSISDNKTSSKSTTTQPETTATITTTTSLGWSPMDAYQNGIDLVHGGDPPTNAQAIRDKLRSRRESKSPSRNRFKRYGDRIAESMNEATAAWFVQSCVLNLDGAREGSSFAFNQRLNGIPKDAGFNNNMPAPQPDFIQGLHATQFRWVSGKAVPGAFADPQNRNSIGLAHIAGEWKQFQGGLHIAQQQAAYDGAALVYGRNRALEAMGTADPAGHASVLTFATDGRTLDIFAHYAAPPGPEDDEDDDQEADEEDGERKVHYRYHKIATADLCSTYQGFRDGCRMVRNAQDHAVEQSFQLRDQLEDHLRKQQRASKGK